VNDQFKNIVDEYNGIFYKICRSYTTNEADFKDLYQEVLIQLWKSLKSFKELSKLSTWIYKVTLNTAISHQKKGAKKHSYSSIDQLEYKLASEGTSAAELAQEKEQKIELLYSCINQLRKDERAIILLHLEQKKYDEIAEIIGITTSHVGVKLKRIKERLHSLLKETSYGRI